MTRIRLHASQVGLVTLAAAFLPLTAPGSAAPSVAIDEFRWKKRVLLIATPAEGDERHRAQEKEWRQLTEDFAAWGVEVVVAPPGHPARKRLPVADDDFVVALVGIDGGIKLTRRGILTAADLRNEMDSTAMRRSELKAAERARQKGERGAPDPSAELKNRLSLDTPATGGGWTTAGGSAGEFSSRCWLYDRSLQAGAPRIFQQPAALWHLQGDAIEALVLPARGEARRVTLGPRQESGESAFLHLEAGDVLSVRLRGGGITGWSLLCETSAGSEPAPLGADQLASRFPEHAAWLRQLAAGKSR